MAQTATTPDRSRRLPGRRALLAVGMAGLVAVTAACGGGGSGSGGGSAHIKLALTAYSTPAAAYAELIPAFQRTPAGANVTFTQSYGASGAQSRAIAAGLPTDIAALSLAPDIDKLVKAGLVDQGWANDPYQGFVTDSVVVFTVRKGNPKGIKTWDDLLKPGVQIVTPNPFTSGGARWNIMAAYGAQVKQGKTDAEATAWVKQMFTHVVAQDKDARTSLQTFTGGKGDVLLGYENDAIAAQQAGQPVDYVIPDQTILVQNPIAVLAKSRHQAQAKAFLDFLRTPEAQKIFAKHGYRPVVPLVADTAQFPTPSELFTINDVGGWPQVNATFFDATKGLLVGIEHSLGVTTG